MHGEDMCSLQRDNACTKEAFRGIVSAGGVPVRFIASDAQCFAYCEVLEDG